MRTCIDSWASAFSACDDLEQDWLPAAHAYVESIIEKANQDIQFYKKWDTSLPNNGFLTMADVGAMPVSESFSDVDHNPYGWE